MNKGFFWRILSRVFVCITLVAASDGLAQPASQEEVIWNGLGTDENSSMPLGNGDIAVNAWTEQNGDLVFLIAKSDAWSENAQLMKVGRVRVELSPNPFVGREDLIQRLTINDACMEVKAGDNSISLWVDANQPVIHLTTKTEQPVTVTVHNELWRTADYHMTQEQLNRSVFNYWEWRSNPNGIDFLADKTLSAGKNQTAWCHYNSHSMYATVLEREHLGSLIGKYEDPLINLCFGAIVEGKGMVRKDVQTLISKKATDEQHILIGVLTEKANSPKDWLRKAQNMMQEAGSSWPDTRDGSTRRVPTAAPGSTFVPLDKGIKSDHYLKLAGRAASRLRKDLQSER